jgi:hypothetical protein
MNSADSRLQRSICPAFPDFRRRDHQQQGLHRPGRVTHGIPAALCIAVGNRLRLLLLASLAAQWLSLVGKQEKMTKTSAS